MTEILQQAGPLLILAVVLLVGVAFGGVARRLHLPGITGQIVAGILLGRAGLDLFPMGSLEGLQPLTHFALGLIAVTVGAHLNIRRLHNAVRRLSLLLLAESTITPLLVFSALFGLADVPVTLSLLLAATAVSTAPATIVALVSETRSKGVFVKTLVAAVALNNMACIVLFEVARAIARSDDGPFSSGLGLASPIGGLLVAAGIGVATALAMGLAARFSVRPERLTIAAVVALVFTSGLADALGVSPLLACLFLGFTQTNLTQTRSQLVDSVFEDFQPAILVVFFTLAGMNLETHHLAVAGSTALVFFTTRFAGKLVAADLAMRLAGATERVRRHLGLALIPQAGVAVGLIILVQEDSKLAGIAGLYSAVVLAVVTVNEIAGPVLTRIALARSGEIGRDRMRLIDFLQEENIVTDFRAETKDEAIERLVDLMIRSHNMRDVDRASLLASVLDREAQASTCLGGGLAVPHAILPKGMPMVGVMALSGRGLDFPTPDDRPVHCMVLLGTAPDERERHLQVLAGLARTVGGDPAFQAQLFHADSAAHACEILHGEESEGFNYFLGEEADR